MMLQERKVLLSLLLGFGFAALLSLPLTRYQEEPAMTMASGAIAPTQFQPRLMQPTRFMQPVMARQPMQPVSAFTPQNEPEYSPYPVTNEDPQRRDLLAAAAFALAGASVKDQAALAAYGDGANVFGGITNPTGFAAFAGEGFSLLLPSKWNPSKEKDFPNVVLRYEDNFDAVNNLVVIKEKSDKSSVDGYGTPEEFLNKFSYLLGQQSYSGKTISEGGFAPDRVSAASVLDVAKESDKKGRTVYKYNILSRTADGDEGGRHQLISATVSGGDLFILKIQVGDKRWFKGAKKEAEGALNSFNIAKA